jgi:K+-sensing histidine kinase KdpD
LITTKFNSFTIFIEDSYKDVGANIHPFLLIKICKELIDNAIKYAEGSNINISLRNEYIESINVTYSVFLFSQNTCSKGIPAKGLSDVQKIINDFNGKFDYLPKKNRLDIMLKIPVTQYKTN